MAFQEGPRPAADDAAEPAGPLEVDTEVLPGGVRVLHVAGEIDTLTRAAFAAALGGPATRPAGLLVVDLTGVTFLSACGINELARASRRAAGSGAELRLAGPRRGVRRALEITGMLDVVPCHDTLADALAPTP